jgi:hypothetical protein
MFFASAARAFNSPNDKMISPTQGADSSTAFVNF